MVLPLLPVLPFPPLLLSPDAEAATLKRVVRVGAIVAWLISNVFWLQA